MGVETDTDPLVAATVAQAYVPVYVDTDARPDLNERYNLGGWPTNALLTPRGDLITGGTFFDTDTFRILLSRVAQSWHDRRSEVEDAVGATRREGDQRRRRRSGAVAPAHAVSQIVDLTMDAFDFRYGGFGHEAKFPDAASIELLLAEFRRTGEARLRDAALISLEAVVGTGSDRTGLVDVDGGVFRYAGHRDWSDLRYERLLTDQASVLTTLVSAFQLSAEKRWAAAAAGIVAFVLGTLFDAERGVFRGSQAAGAGAPYFGLERAGRDAAVAPDVDVHAYVGSNAQIASALIRAGCVLSDDRALHAGLSLADAIAVDARLGPDEFLLGHVIESDKASGPVLLASQAFAARALVDAYEVCGDHTRLTAAAGILDEVHNRLRDAVTQVYTDTIVEPGADGYLSRPLFPITENAVAADTLIRLATLLDAPALETRAQALLSALAPFTEEHGYAAAPYALALLRTLVRERVSVHLGGGTSPESLLPLVRAAHAVYVPFKAIRFVDPERDRARARAMAPATSVGPAAMVCRGAGCAEPTGDPERLVAIVARAASVPGT